MKNDKMYCEKCAWNLGVHVIRLTRELSVGGIVTMASGLAKWAQELTKGVHGYWANGRWTPLAISARHRAKLRKDTLLAGG